MAQKIRAEQPVFLHDGDVAIGAVRSVSGNTVEIYFENAGDFAVPMSAVQDVHFDKVILDGRKLDSRLQTLLAGAHSQEDDEDHLPADD